MREIRVSVCCFCALAWVVAASGANGAGSPQTDLVRWVKTQITPSLTVMLPEELTPMSDAMAAQHFPSVRKPLGAFTSADQLVDFSVHVSATQWPDTDLILVQEFFKASIYSLYDRVDMLTEETKAKRNPSIDFEFNSTAASEIGPPERKYHYVQYRVSSKQTLVIAFSCPYVLSERWSPLAKSILQSVRMR